MNKQEDSLPSHQLDDISSKSSKENFDAYYHYQDKKVDFLGNVSENKQLVGVALLPLVPIFCRVDRFLWKAESHLLTTYFVV